MLFMVELVSVFVGIVTTQNDATFWNPKLQKRRSEAVPEKLFLVYLGT